MESKIFNHVTLFMLVYSLGFYLGKANEKWIHEMSKLKCIVGWLVMTFLLFVSLYFYIGSYSKIVSYNNPLILFQAMMIILLFIKLKIKYSVVINNLAHSTLMVYLVSENVFTRRYFVDLVQFMCNNIEGVNLVLFLSFLFVCLFLAMLLLDRLLAKIYNPIIHCLLSTLRIKCI